MATIKVGRAPTAVAISPDGTHAYVTNTRANSVSVIDTATNEVVAPAIKVGRDPIALAVAPDGSRVYVADVRDDTVSVIRAGTNSLAPKKISTGKSPISMAITPDGHRLYIANSREGTVSVPPPEPVGQSPPRYGSRTGRRPSRSTLSPLARM